MAPPELAPIAADVRVMRRGVVLHLMRARLMRAARLIRASCCRLHAGHPAHRVLIADGDTECSNLNRNQGAAKDELPVTFRSCARIYIAVQQVGCKSPKHSKQWSSTLEEYAHPVIGHLHPREDHPGPPCCASSSRSPLCQCDVRHLTSEI